jgi:hypothetical protein
MPIKFPPADWRYLRFKLETAAQIAEKIITFEFPHFVSPFSCYPSAHNLFERYVTYEGAQWEAGFAAETLTWVKSQRD